MRTAICSFKPIDLNAYKFKSKNILYLFLRRNIDPPTGRDLDSNTPLDREKEEETTNRTCGEKRLTDRDPRQYRQWEMLEKGGLRE